MVWCVWFFRRPIIDLGMCFLDFWSLRSSIFCSLSSLLLWQCQKLLREGFCQHFVPVLFGFLLSNPESHEDRPCLGLFYINERLDRLVLLFGLQLTRVSSLCIFPSDI